MALLTATQREVLAALRRRADQGEPTPTYRDLCAEFGWASTGTARDHLQALARKGVLLLADGRARLTRLPEDTHAVGRVPLVDVVTPDGTETIIEHLPVPLNWIRHGSHFAVRVNNDSFRGEAIIKGDIVIARRQSEISNGEMVVAFTDQGTTLQIVGDRNRRSPQGANFRASTKVAKRILGVVVGIMRQLNGNPDRIQPYPKVKQRQKLRRASSKAKP